MAAASVPVGAQHGHMTGAVVRITVDAPTAGTETVRRVVRSSIEIYAEQQGLVVAGDDRANADFLIYGSVVVRGEQVDVELRLSLIETGQVLARAATTQTVGLTLDRFIAGLTGDVLEQARSYVTAAAAERRDAAAEGRDAAAERRDTATDRAAPSSAAPSTAAPSTAGRSPPDSAQQPPPPTAEPPPDTAARASRSSVDSLLAISTAFAPFIPIERGARYLGLSYGGTLAVTLLPPADDWFGVGLTVRAFVGAASGNAATADLILAPVAVSVLLAGGTEPITSYLKISGGAAFLQATNSSLGAIRNVIPYAGAELGVAVRLFGALGLETGIAFEAFLEESIILVGFSPGVGLVMRM
jgi:hypothetical protein